ncbi:MAG: UbiA family prenyltransferase [Candidatus Omnitrophica bacterium]|nr:UbiA family prenyltransferase [Candidatus Omnitrophota bacterium]
MRFRDVAEALKLQHTIFALPFAYIGAWVAAAEGGRTAGFPGWRLLGWLTVAMIAARTAGMCFNRVMDLPFDRLNPRTADWPVSQGRVTPVQLIALGIGSTLLFLYAAGGLNPLCLKLAPIALIGLAAYPALKRFTWACHFGLGLVLGMAPAAGWLAVTGAWDPRVIWIFAAVAFWVAGFDILYSTMDVDFDRANRLYSIPQRFGVPAALKIARISHFLMIAAMAVFGMATRRQWVYWIGWAAVAVLLHFEHQLVSPTDLKRVNQAFFTVNGWVSLILFVATIADCI